MGDQGSVSEILELQCDNNDHDVFLSFRGEDTRHTFTGYLYDALIRKGVNTFMDNENLRIGEQIRPQLIQAIQGSKTSIVVLSENYADSTWCLDELLIILKCKEEKNQLVFPIFYKVEPSDVRYQRNSYAQAMTKHENRFGNDSDKVKRWRDALSHISTLSGHHLKEGTKGSSKIEGIKLDHREEVNWTHDAFEKMRKLRILVVRNSNLLSGPVNLPNQLRLLDWKGYPSRSFHPDFYPKKIAAFNLCCSALVLDKPFQFRISHSISEWCLNLETLHFNSASLSDEDLNMIIQSFPKLKELNVSSNHFVSLPDCIKESTCLTSLDVSYCVKLEEIPELPSSVQKVDARHCDSLTTETSSMLWSQLLKEINRLEIVLPKTEIPEWFDYHVEGGNIIFWVQGKFPDVALAFVFEKVMYDSVRVQLFIEGEDVHVHGQHQQYVHNFNVAEDHVLLFDVRIFFSVEERNGVDARLGHEDGWKSVHVKFDTEMTVRLWGVYVYKQDTKMDAIQFTCPHSWIPSLSRRIEKDEEEKPSREDWSDWRASIEEASCSESHDSNSQTPSHTHTCSPCCIRILSTLKKLICCNAKSRKRLHKSMGFEGFEEGGDRDGGGGGGGSMGFGGFEGSLSKISNKVREEKTVPDERLAEMMESRFGNWDTHFGTRVEGSFSHIFNKVREERVPRFGDWDENVGTRFEGSYTEIFNKVREEKRVPDENLAKMMESRYGSWDTHVGTRVEDSFNFTKEELLEDDDNISPYVDTQMQLPFFSESLETVVGNLQRVMAVSSDDDESESEVEA
ncbi:hypothetical protein RIF29_32505 [Crotalaria pallida]|uniref:TIR domain-containing protein n=1 Tax=Crotalaria pallida TaxID=3830 RepID=A0AAN9EI94_CROPI